MKTEIIVVLIASISSFLLGLINIAFLVRISSKQNEIELKKTKIELLESRRQTIEKVKANISTRFIDVRDLKPFIAEQYYPKLIDYFQKNSSEVYSIAYLLNTDFINQLKQLNQEIDANILSAKQGLPISESETKRILEEISKMDVIMKNKIDEKLSEIEHNVNILIK